MRRKWPETISHGVFLLRELYTSEDENTAYVKWYFGTTLVGRGHMYCRDRKRVRVR